jgi:chromosomal replication initiation ATPase DnaA
VNTSRLDQLRNLRLQIDQEIEREERFLRRARRLSSAAKVIITTRGDYTDRVIAVTAAHFAVAPGQLISIEKHRDVVQARMVAAWLLRQDGRSYSEIGRALDKDHTTIMHAVKRVEADEGLTAHALVVRGALIGDEGAA